MVQLSTSAYRSMPTVKPASWFIIAMILLLVSGCADFRRSPPDNDRQPVIAPVSSSADALLIELRDFHALEDDQARSQELANQRALARDGSRLENLKLALLLAQSVNVENLREAKQRFQELFAITAPLPAALDSLARLEYAQVERRLSALETAARYESALARSAAARSELEAKIQALTEIEQDSGGIPDDERNVIELDLDTARENQADDDPEQDDQ